MRGVNRLIGGLAILAIGLCTAIVADGTISVADAAVARTAIRGNTATRLFPSITLSGANLVTVNVQIVSGGAPGDALGILNSALAGWTRNGSVLTSTGGVVVNWSYNSTTQTLSLYRSGGMSCSAFAPLLQAVYFSASPRDTSQNSTRKIEIFPIEANANGPYNAGDGVFHIYQYVANSGINWNAARAADNVSYWGWGTGYLATITSSAENKFARYVNYSPAGWLGGSDMDLEGTWKWMDGPEAGQIIGVGEYPLYVPSLYDNWTGTNPSDIGNNEDYLHFWPSSLDWNDAPNTYSLDGYITEWSGTSSATQGRVNVVGNAFMNAMGF